MTSLSPSPLPLHRKLAFSIVAVLLLLGALELVLAIAGVRPGFEESDPYVSFVGNIPLFEKRTTDDGQTWLETSPRKQPLFNLQSFPLQKPPGSVRVFCLGGSTTYGRPYDDKTSFAGWLRAYLPAADPKHEWEVINAGGISYASYRVAMLMEELVQYEPDLFIVYTGQNEFLERRSYGSIQQAPPWIRQLNVQLGRTRVFTAVRQLIDKARGGSNAAPTKGTALLPAEVNTILDGSVGPRDFHRDDQLRADIVHHYALNVRRMIDMAHRAGAKILFVMPASNLGNCTPFKSAFATKTTAEQRERFGFLMSQARENLQNPDALALVREAVTIDPRRSDAQYLLGQILRARGRTAEARRAFERALNEDVCPLRAVEELQQSLAELCREDGVPLVDFGAIVDGSSPDSIPGQELFLDHVHPTIEGNRLLAEALLDRLIADDIVNPDPAWNAEARGRVEARVRASVDRRDQAAALRNLSKVLEWSGKTEEADKLAERALEIDADDPGALLQMAKAHQRAGEFPQAEALLQRAQELAPTSGRLQGALGKLYLDTGRIDEAVQALSRANELHPDDPTVMNNLGIALHLAGRSEEAIGYFVRVHEIVPTDAKSWNNQGTAESVLGRYDEAIESYTRAIELVPDFVAALYGLGVAQGQLQRNEAAIQSMRRVIELEPEHVDAHYALGVLYRRNARIAEATQEFEIVLRLNPDHENAGRFLKELSEN